MAGIDGEHRRQDRFEGMINMNHRERQDERRRMGKHSVSMSNDG